MSESRFAGKTILVTGAGSGIGKATAERLLNEGARVIAADISEKRLSDLKAAHRKEPLVVVAGDIAADETVEALLAACDGKLEGLANVAGIMDNFLPPHEVDDATWDRVMNVNLKGPMRLTRALLPLLRASKGSIANVASEAGLKASSAGVAYTCSKHAMIGFTRSLAFYYGLEGLRSNAVCPGAVATNIEVDMACSPFAMKRVGPVMAATAPPTAEPEAIAAALCWLLSDDSLNVNGAIMPSDGGWCVY